MAFNKSAAKTAAAPVVAGSFEKAEAFVNLYLPSTTNASGRTKIGAIPLRGSKPMEAAIIERLSNDPEAVKAMLGVLILDFQTVNNAAIPASALGF